MQWTDVSAHYAGVFFRVEGGRAASFGQTQEESAPHLVKVEYGVNDDYQEVIDTFPGQTSKRILSSGLNNGAWHSHETLRFTLSGGEVRPHNMAVKVWKRTG